MEHKYKVGDWVKHKTVESASEGRIIRLREDGYGEPSYDIKWVSWNDTECHDPEQSLELLERGTRNKFRVGDIVRHKTTKPNEIGVIVEIYSDDSYVVEWEDSENEGDTYQTTDPFHVLTLVGDSNKTIKKEKAIEVIEI